MSGFMIRGAAKAPYGPGNPPPPPPGQPPPAREPVPPAKHKKPLPDMTAAELDLYRRKKVSNTAPNKKLPTMTPEEFALFQKNKEARQARKARIRLERLKAGLSVGPEKPKPGSEVVRDQFQAQGCDDAYRVHDVDIRSALPLPTQDSRHVRRKKLQDHTSSNDGYRSPLLSAQEQSYRSRSPVWQRESHTSGQTEWIHDEHEKYAQGCDGRGLYSQCYRSRSPPRQPSVQTDGGVRSFSDLAASGGYGDNDYWAEDQQPEQSGDRHSQQRPYEAKQTQVTSSQPRYDRGFEIEDEVDWDDDDLNEQEVSPENAKLIMPRRTSVQPARASGSHEWQGKESKSVQYWQDGQDTWMDDRPRDAPVEQPVVDHRHGDHDDVKYDRDTLSQVQHLDHTPAKSSTAQPVASVALKPPRKPVRIPDTVYNLRAYEAELEKSMPDSWATNPHITATGKIKPFVYGGGRQLDLGLCYATFLTNAECKSKQKCPWRHHPLREDEVKWLSSGVQPEGAKFLKKVEKFWAYPKIPLPGANLAEKADIGRGALTKPVLC
ncbi:hypothetical protein T440DRAFT_525406 [Plenodomus tracheiphilus IPT5]|uniref:Uncharacterized protein n=1 Tax=Plenodomus tracheiphilus IPT5 TaxID=1408161 RepID=A0A6A7BBM7_9PLEO|nr:hypothetical protein T440DRAFT_525406 [Plenodomus tracheiphilus IPT5]